MTTGHSSTLATLVPGWLLSSLVEDPSRPREGAISRAQAAVLFVDLSGFSTLADALEREERAGPEQLASILSECFTAVVECVVAQGGDVIRFAGDALVAVFRSGADCDAAMCVKRAAAGATAAHRAAEGLGPWKEVRLKLRAGVAYGEVGLLDVGGEGGRWEFLAFGSTILDAAHAQGAASSGETVLDETALALVQDSITTETVAGRRARLVHVARPPAPLPVPPAAPREAAMRSYLAEAVARRIDAGHEDWLAEYRELSVLFVNLVDPAFATLEHAEELQSAVRAIQAAVAALDGSTHLVVVDDKGVVVLAIFGLPLLAHEDDGVRAAQAARDVHSALRSMGVTHGIGLTRGRVFCGFCGSEARRDYVTLGHVVNVAARLMKAAGGGLLCDGASARAASPAFTFEALPALTLKGIPYPVDVFRPIEAVWSGVAQRQDQSLVGREDERERIAEVLRRMTSGGRAAVVLVEGEPGIGKSAIVRDTLQAALAGGITTASGGATAVERATAYGPWRAILSRLLGLDALADPKARGSRVVRDLGDRPELVSWAPLLNAVLPVAIEETEAVRQMPAALRGVNTRELLVELIRGVAEDRPLVIALDDAQWMDASSWELAAALVRTTPRLMLVIAARPMGAESPAVWDELAGMDDKVLVRLDRLPRRDVEALVCRQLRVQEIPPDVAAVVCDRAEGHPFFAKELAQTLRDAGQIVIEHGRCTLAKGTTADDLELPGTIQGVLNSRLDLLSPDEQLVIKVASVIGRVFRRDLLEAVVPVALERRSVAAAIAEICRHGLAALESPPPDEAYAFDHVLVQEAAYNLLPVVRRRELHRAVALELESSAEDDATRLPVLAHHWQMAGEPAKAIVLLDKAGTMSLERGANAEAVTYLEQADRLAREDGRPLDSLPEVQRQLDLGEAMLRLGRVVRSAELNEDVLRRLGEAPSGGPARAGRIAAGISKQTATVLFHRSARKNEDEEQVKRRVLRASAASRLVEHRYYERDTVGAFHLCLMGINEAEAAGEPSAAANAYVFLALGAMLLRREGLAAHYLDRVRLSESCDDLALADLTEGVSYAVLCRWDDADRLITSSWNLARSVNDAAMQGRAAEAYGLIDEVRNPAQALEHRRAQATKAAESANPLQEFWGLLGVAAAHLVRGENGQARDICAELSKRVPDGDITSQVRYQALLAASCVAAGDLGTGATEADRALELVRAWPSRQPTDLAAFTALADCCVQLWRAGKDAAGEARATAAFRALAAYSKMYPAGQPRRLRAEAALALAGGDEGKAKKLLARAAESAARLDAAYDQASALAELADLTAAPEERSAMSSAAREIQERLEATPGRRLQAAAA